MAVKNERYSVQEGIQVRQNGARRIFPRESRGLMFAALFGLLALCFATRSNCQQKTDASLPEVAVKHIAGSGRFSNSDYARLMRGDGIYQVTPQVIFARMKAAAEAKENYKALYFARIFTTSQPDSAAGWKNRALLALSLGLHEEAVASELRASDAANKIQVPFSVLPGRGLTVKPASLSDWAGAVLLLADGTSSVRGGNFLLAVRDDISGVKVSTSDEVREQDQQLTQMGLPPEGPWSDPKPINVNQVLTNCFVLEDAEAMHFKSMNTGQFMGAMLMSGLAGMSRVPSAAAADSQVAGQLASASTDVKSNYVGGHYMRATYPPDSVKPDETKDQPKASGKTHAVGSPIPILWAAGPLAQPNFTGLVSQGQKPLAWEYDARKDVDPAKDKPKQHELPALSYPRLASLCSDTCSDPVSIMEVMVSADDLSAMAPAMTGRLPLLASQRAAYLSDTLTLSPGNAGPGKFIGLDAKGKAYVFRVSPTVWITAGK